LYGEVEVNVIYSGGKEKGEILDISATGLGFETNYEINFESGILFFELEGAKFERKAKLIRKKNLESGKSFYAVSFYDFTEKERQMLFQVLMKIDARKRLGRSK
jgi:hypothetical protein